MAFVWQQRRLSRCWPATPVWENMTTPFLSLSNIHLPNAVRASFTRPSWLRSISRWGWHHRVCIHHRAAHTFWLVKQLLCAWVEVCELAALQQSDGGLAETTLTVSEQQPLRRHRQRREHTQRNTCSHRHVGKYVALKHAAIRAYTQRKVEVNCLFIVFY